MSIYKNDTKHSESSCGVFQDGCAMKSLPIEHKLASFSKASSWYTWIYFCDFVFESGFDVFCAIQIAGLSLAFLIIEVVSDWIFDFCCTALTGHG